MGRAGARIHAICFATLNRVEFVVLSKSQSPLKAFCGHWKIAPLGHIRLAYDRVRPVSWQHIKDVREAFGRVDALRRITQQRCSSLLNRKVSHLSVPKRQPRV